MFAFAPPADAQTLFEGPVVADGIANSVDVTDAALQVLQAQAARDRCLTYAGFTTRWAPGAFVLADGQQVAGNLARWQLGGGVGLGTPKKVGASAGFAFDGVRETGAASLEYAVGQGLFDFGVAVHDVQLSVGGRLDLTGGGASGLGWEREFQPTGDQTYRAVLPQSYASGVQTTTWSAYHGPSGAFLTATHQGATLYDLRANVQPLARVLPPLFGLPALGLRWLDDRLRRATVVDPEPFPEAAAAPEPDRKHLSSDLGLDDALGIGLRTRLVVDWRPSVAFRYAELGLVKSIGELEDFERLGGGFRLALAHSDPTWTPAVESFAMVAFGPAEDAERDGRGLPRARGHVAVSYSYGVPDSVTWLPIPSAHVLGVQVVAGAPETSRPIVPIVRGLDAATP